MKLKTKLIVLISIIVLVASCNSLRGVYDSSVSLYNTTASLKLQYQQKQQELIAFFDAKYLAFTKKDSIAGFNKDVFITVTTIIMSNRKDGENLAWKWVHENQQIPYEEFTSFYHDLSDFVDEQYGGLFDIEKQKQLIVNQHNRILILFPNNIINHYLKIQPLVYSFSYLSDSSRKLFNIK